MRGLWRVLLLAVVVGAGAACGSNGETTQTAGADLSSTSTDPANSQRASPESVPAPTEDEGVMPDLTGATLNELGDGTGVLYDLHDRIGIQETIHLPSDEAPEGVVLDQDPVPGTPLEAITGWSLTISEGGPVVTFDELPRDVASLATALDGLDGQSLFVEKETDLGTVYKHDDWLFGLECDAVQAAYRTFSDARYDAACPVS